MKGRHWGWGARELDRDASDGAAPSLTRGRKSRGARRPWHLKAGKPMEAWTGLNRLPSGLGEAGNNYSHSLPAVPTHYSKPSRQDISATLQRRMTNVWRTHGPKWFSPQATSSRALISFSEEQRGVELKRWINSVMYALQISSGGIWLSFQYRKRHYGPNESTSSRSSHLLCTIPTNAHSPHNLYFSNTISIQSVIQHTKIIIADQSPHPSTGSGSSHFSTVTFPPFLQPKPDLERSSALE